VTNAVLAAFTVVVLTAGLVAAAVVDEPPPRANEVLGATGKLGLSQLAAAQAAEEAERSPAPAPPSTATTIAPRPASTGSTAAPPLPGHRTPGAVVTPFQTGRSEWSGVSNGITLHLVMSPAAPRAGETVTFVVEASMPGALCCGLMLQSGDGGGDQYPAPPALGAPAPCAAQEPKSSSVRGEMRHVYNKAGRWNFSVSARSGGICTPSASVYGSLDGTIEVGGGTSGPSPQGPARPTVRPASVYPYESQVITLVAEARDDDGYVDRLVVDWGDGSATQTYRNPQPCKTMASGWPAGTYTILPLWMGVGAVTHRYPDGRPYTVTVTAISTACDRTAEQRVSGTLVFPEPLPPPPPFESIPLPPVSQIPPPPPISSLPVPPPGPPPSLPPIVTTTSVPARP
jgi:hypothetical protein